MRSDADWSAAHLGNVIRAIRTSKGMLLKDLARESGLSASFLSQVEQGQSDISVGRLMRVAQTLQVRMTDLVELPEPPARPIARAANRVSVPSHTDGVTIELLAESLSGSQTYTIATLDDGVAFEARNYRIPGQDYFVYMIEGRATLDFSNGEDVTLEAGDSISFPSEDFRRMTNLHPGPTRLIWLSTPTS
jgi:transcriptional regulator with XRE-family HTH domain